MKKLMMMMLVTIGMMFCLTGCDDSAQDEERMYTEDLMQQINDEIGMPNITEYYEKKMAKEIYEKRDDSELICYVYNQSLDGQYVYVGQSIGYGLPYSTQYTCPEFRERYNGSSVTLPQADPNGLYSPDGLSATWLMMADEKTGETYIMYCEPTIVVTENKLPERLVADWSLEGIDY